LSNIKKFEWIKIQRSESRKLTYSVSSSKKYKNFQPHEPIPTTSTATNSLLNQMNKDNFSEIQLYSSWF